MAGYSTQGTRIVGPTGADFVPVGMNMACFGSDGGLWQNRTHEQVSADALKAWDCNTVRLVNYVTTRNSWSVRNSTTGYNGKAAGFQSVIEVSRRATDMYRANGIVVILEAHDFTTDAASETQANRDKWHGEVVEYWVEMAKLYKNDSGVWFNLYNEPSMINAEYVSRQNTAAAAIRAQGANNIIVIDAPRWGQDIPTAGQDQGFIPSMAPTLAATHGNVVYSHHNYGGNNGWFGTPYSFGKYLDQVQSAGLPMLIGEIGWPRACGWDTSYSNMRNAGIVTIAEALRRGIGILWWAGAHNDEFDLHYDPVANQSCEIWDTKTTTLPLSDGGAIFKQYTLRQAGKPSMANLNVVTPTGLGKQMKAAISANRDGVTDTVRAAMGGGVLTTGSTTTRPTTDPNVRVVFYTPSPPTAVMLAGDVWEPTA